MLFLIIQTILIILLYLHILGLVAYKKEIIAVVVSFVVTIGLILAVASLVIIFLHELNEKAMSINTYSNYQNQTLLLMSYSSRTISINVSLNVDQTSTDPVNIRVYTSNTVPNRSLQKLPQKNIPNLSSNRGDHGRHYNYNYMDGDEPIFLQKGSSINYTLHFTSICTGVPVSYNSATLYLFDNFNDYDHFKNKHSNVAVTMSHFQSTKNLFWSFPIDYDSQYYVGLEVEDCCLVSGNVTVTQASYESSALSQVCDTLNISRPSCVIDLHDHFTDCGIKGHVFVNIPAGYALAEISYKSKSYYFSCVCVFIAVPLLVLISGWFLLFIAIVACVYVSKKCCSCNFCRGTSYSQINNEL